MSEQLQIPQLLCDGLQILAFETLCYVPGIQSSWIIGLRLPWAAFYTCEHKFYLTWADSLCECGLFQKIFHAEKLAPGLKAYLPIFQEANSTLMVLE